MHVHKATFAFPIVYPSIFYPLHRLPLGPTFFLVGHPSATEANVLCVFEQLEEEWIKSNPEWVEELQIMLRTK